MVDILAVGAHPDDIELGAGGTVASLVRQGKKVAMLDLTNGEPTPFGTPETRMEEATRSSAILGVEKRITLDLPNRYLMDTVEARIKVAEVYRELRPRIILLPFREDAHPDHIQASRLAEAARFTAKYTKTDMKAEPYYPARVFYFFCIHLKRQFDHSFIFDISDTLDAKLEAVASYHSQFFAGNPERGNEIIERLRTKAAYYGAMIGVRYGEPFLRCEEIGLRSFDPLIP